LLIIFKVLSRQPISFSLFFFFVGFFNLALFQISLFLCHFARVEQALDDFLYFASLC